MIVNPKEISTETGSSYPEQFKTRIVGRVKQRLGNAAGFI